MRVSVVIEPQHPLRKTALGSEMKLPLASHTVNFTGMVRPPWALYTLLPSAFIGGKMTPPGSDPMHVPYVTVKDAVALLGKYELSPAKLAPTPDGYTPGRIPDRLAP